MYTGFLCQGWKFLYIYMMVNLIAYNIDNGHEYIITNKLGRYLVSNYFKSISIIV